MPELDHRHRRSANRGAWALISAQGDGSYAGSAARMSAYRSIAISATEALFRALRPPIDRAKLLGPAIAERNRGAKRISAHGLVAQIYVNALDFGPLADVVMPQFSNLMRIIWMPPSPLGWKMEYLA